LRPHQLQHSGHEIFQLYEDTSATFNKIPSDAVSDPSIGSG
jgi:hypothetical protein